jgi:hypothetical protein
MASIDEACADGVLEALHSTGDGRLGEVQLAGRRAGGTRVGESDEGANVFNVRVQHTEYD